MDAGRTSICCGCGQPNPIHGLWCRQCGAPLSQPFDLETAPLQQDKSLTATIELYGRVLQDLNRLAGRGEIPDATYDTIKSFYAGRLAERRSQEEIRQRAAALQKCVYAARTLVHSTTGRLQEAIHTLEEGIRKYPEEKILSEMVREIRSHIEKRERALLAVKAARNLLAAAKTCLQDSRIEDAEVRLNDALALDPDNKEINATLAQVQRLLEDQRRRPPVPEPTPPIPEMAGAQIAVFEAPIELAAADQTPVAPSFAEEEEVPSPTQRWVEAASEWSKVLKPFLLDNVGWFIGVFLIIAGFVVLITTFWRNIEENRLLMFSLVYFSMVATTGIFFALAYFLRVKHPELETSSNVLLIIVALLIPLIFAAAALTTLVPAG